MEGMKTSSKTSKERLVKKMFTASVKKDKSLEGKRVRLISMNDPWSKLSPGAEGTVKNVDDMGTVHVQWDEGSNLGLIPGEDKWLVPSENS